MSGCLELGVAASSCHGSVRSDGDCQVEVRGVSPTLSALKRESLSLFAQDTRTNPLKGDPFINPQITVATVQVLVVPRRHRDFNSLWVSVCTLKRVE